jgi:hypothetical protein
MRERLRDMVMIDALRMLGRDAKPSVAFIQVSGARDVFKIGREGAVIVTARSAVA